MSQKTSKVIRKYCKVLRRDETEMKRIYSNWNKQKKAEFITLAKKVLKEIRE